MTILPLFLLVFILKRRQFYAELIYNEPTYPLHNPNFTLGGLFGITSNQTSSSASVDKDGIDRSIAMMCALKQFNEARGPFNVTGTFNGLIYDSGDTLKESEYAAMRLLEYDLKESDTAEAPEEERIQIGAVIADLKSTIYFATQPVYSGFPFTFLGVQYLSSGIGSNTTLQPRPVFHARIVPQSFVFSAAASSYMAQAIVNMLLYFNWSLVTVMYSSDIFGMEGQAFLQPIIQENYILTVCSVISKRIEAVNESELQAVADCLNQNDSRVVILWSGIDSSIIVKICKLLQSKTKYKLIFITPGSEPESYINSASLEGLSSSFLFKNINLVPFTDSFKECIEGINPATQEYFDPELFANYWQEKYNCRLDDPECFKQFALVSTIDINQVIDSTMLILKSIYLMQNNCSSLNGLLNFYNLNFKNRNYCTIDEFTATDIYQIVNLVLYLGLPEFLTLGTNSSESLHSLQIIQLNQTGKIVSVGNYIKNELTIEQSKLYWQNGQVPLSGNTTVKRFI